MRWVCFVRSIDIGIYILDMKMYIKIYLCNIVLFLFLGTELIENKMECTS